MREPAARDVPLHGECGGYMVLGAGLEAADGQRHEMLGLLGLETSFRRAGFISAIAGRACFPPAPRRWRRASCGATSSTSSPLSPIRICRSPTLSLRWPTPSPIAARAVGR